jgi:predicted RNA-binding Zn-ribbon protein involved in translation (DUF1610 family)
MAMRIIANAGLQRRQFVCPACRELVAPEPEGGRRFRCRACGAALIIRFEYYWLYIAICALGALAAAVVQGAEEPLFALSFLGYFAVLLIITARILLPFFPVKVELDKPSVTTLNVGDRRQ